MQFSYNLIPVAAVSPQDIKIDLNWPCSVTPCIEGEFRRSLSQVPGLSLEMSGIAYNQDYAFALSEALVMGNFNLITGNREQLVYVPFWADIAISTGSNTAAIDGTNHRFMVGSEVLVWGDESNNMVTTIDNIFGGVITLADTPTFEFREVVPLILMNLNKADMTNKRLSARYTISATEISPTDLWITESDSSLLDKFSVDSNVRYGVDNVTNAFTTMTSSQTSQWRLRNQNKRSIEVSHETVSRSEYDNLLSMLQYMRGRYRSHGMATNRRDLQATVNYASGDTIIVRKSHEDLQLYYGDYKISNFGDSYTDTISVYSVSDLGTDVQITLTAPMPKPIGENTIISRVRDYRFSTDKFTIKSILGGSRYSFSTSMEEVL